MWSTGCGFIEILQVFTSSWLWQPFKPTSSIWSFHQNKSYFLTESPSRCCLSYIKGQLREQLREEGCTWLEPLLFWPSIIISCATKSHIISWGIQFSHYRFLFIISVVSFSGPCTCTCKHTHREEREGESQAPSRISHSEGYSGVTEPFLAVGQNPDIHWSCVDCSLWCMAPQMSAAAECDTLSVIPPEERFTRCVYSSGQIMRVVIQHARGISDGFLCLIHTVMNRWCAW